MKTVTTLFHIALLSLTSTAWAEDREDLTEKLENIPGSVKHAYGLHDNDGRGMDCLEVFQPAGRSGDYAGVYGIYHHLKDGVFSVHLAHSLDLIHWTHIIALDSHASQAAIEETADGGFLLAFEKDAPNSCWMRLRFFQNLTQLKTAKFAKEFDIQRSLAPTAEGTPSFESVKMSGDQIDKSQITLRFHYFEDTRVDQQALGTLTNFKSWTATPLKKISEALKKAGGRGNLGDRDRFTWRKQNYYLQEVQGIRNDWSSWRVYLCDRDGLPLQQLKLKSHNQATAFANPSVTHISDETGHRRMVITMFLLSEGNSPSERGQLLYVIDEP
jgi:hypothetical protein